MAIKSITVNENFNSNIDDDSKKRCCRKKTLICSVVAICIMASLITFIVMKSRNPSSNKLNLDIGTRRNFVSKSKLEHFKNYVVCSDSPICSTVGKNILKANGSAVDAAIATMFCNGLANMQSMGIGGGFFMVVYLRNELKSYSVIAREKAPGLAKGNMYEADHNASTKGPLAVAVPGEVRGMWAAHKRWGRLSWSTLIKPTIEMCLEGFIMSPVMADGLRSAPYIVNDVNLKNMFYDTKRNDWYPAGTKVKPSRKLCETLEKIANNGGDEMYNGTLANDVINDLQSMGSIITKKDLEEYEAKIIESLSTPFEDGTIYSAPPPSSGVLIGYIINILSYYKMNLLDNFSTTASKILTYHRIVEAFKFAYAARSKLGDVDFVDNKSVLEDLTSREFAEKIFKKIKDNSTTSDYSYYGANFTGSDDHGTAQISVFSSDGDAVTITSSINYYFGAGFTSPSTGIVLNNVMDDFSSPYFTNMFGLKPSPSNFIQPNKRPMSSMSPIIIVDKDLNVKIVNGGSGGSKIISAVALTTIEELWLGMDPKSAVDMPRIHHQLSPMVVSYQKGFDMNIIRGLENIGHKTKEYEGRGSIICSLCRNISGIYANADYRKGGDAYGL